MLTLPLILAWSSGSTFRQADARQVPPPDGARRPGGTPVVHPTDRPADLPPPASAPDAPEPTPRDDQVAPATTEAGEPLPKSKPRPDAVGGAPSDPAPAATGGAGEAESFTLRADRLGTGKQKVALSVRVQAPEVINLTKEATIRIVVRNEASNDAHGVVLAYHLPDSLEFVRNEAKEPELKDPSNPQDYTWNKPLIGANSEWSVGFRVRARDSKPCEHIATVTAKAGTRERTIIQEPKLQVEVLGAPGRPLKGEQVKFEITVVNTGTGPAKDVTVQATLSEGLKVDGEDRVEQVIPVINPGQRVALDALQADTVAGGKQTCTVEVASPDVNALPEEHRVARSVEVTRPELDVQISGPEKRITKQPIEYKLMVRNTGTAPARGVTVSASLPTQGGKLRGPAPVGSTFNLKDRKLVWTIPVLEPGEPVEYRFPYDTSTAGMYRCTAESVSGTLRVTKQMLTEVAGMADLDLDVEQTQRFVDVGRSNYYDFKIKNFGTKEATKIQLSGTLVNLKILKSFQEDIPGKFGYNPDPVNPTAYFVFPEIPQLRAGESITLSIEVVGIKAGKANATVSLAHDEMGTDEASKIRQSIYTTITDNNAPPR